MTTKKYEAIWSELKRLEKRIDSMELETGYRLKVSAETPAGYNAAQVDVREAVTRILAHLKLRMVRTEGTPATTKIAKELKPDERPKNTNFDNQAMAQQLQAGARRWWSA
jgi:hypothetical protein